MEREQFTFYRSYYEAIKCLTQKDQTKVLMAICAYALDETVPSLSGVPLSVFTLIRPTLDSGRNKALNRQNKAKTNKEQTKNKRTTNEKQSGKEKEGENEREKEGEVESEGEGENDSSTPDTLLTSGISPPSSGAERTQSKREERFERFWDSYPRKVGKGAALKAWAKINPSEELTRRMIDAVQRQSQSQQWTRENGQYIPHPTTWLNQGRWEDETEVAATGTRRKSFSEIAAEMAKRTEGKHDD